MTNIVSVDYMFKRVWPPCSKYDNYSRFSSQHNCVDLYDHLMSTSFDLNFDNEQDIPLSFGDYKESG